MNTYTSTSSQETELCGKELAITLLGGDILLLHGDLGAGKTTFVKGIAAHLGIREPITSPTFALIQIYPIADRIQEIDTLVHIDTYRIETPQDLLDIGIEDYLGNPHCLTIIEWPDAVKTLFENKKTTQVRLNHGSEGERTITIEHANATNDTGN